MSTDLLFSIVMPTYNRENLIRDSLESIRSQTYRNFEIILIDDGSTDQTCEVVSAKYPEVKILRRENSGPGAARNAGVIAAKGEYIAFLDSDDLWFPWTLATYIDLIAQNNSPCFLTGRPYSFEHSGDLTAVSDAARSFEYFEDYLQSGDAWRWYGVSSFVIRRDTFLRIGGFADGRINSEDALLALCLGTEPGFVHTRSPYTFGYRVHVGNVTQDLAKTSAGIDAILSSEDRGELPGGPARKADRWRILSRHIRPHVLALARQGQGITAIHFYLETLPWHLRSFRWKFVLPTPLLIVVGVLNSTIRKLRGIT
ncbi:MAG: glycosyltransferase family A protein [Planctomycetaceae bacterium]